ncbi:MAG: hypothetical protein AAF614_06420 [Chloroflexota bacterium]
MWLIYLRFDVAGQVLTYHITASTKKEVDAVCAIAEQYGPAKSARLVELAYFYARGTIKPKHVPNFHFFKAAEFIERCQNATGARLDKDFINAVPNKRQAQARGQASRHITQELDTSAIRKMLSAAFNDAEFTGFCQDRFPDAAKEFADGMTVGSKITQLINYCTRYGQLEEMVHFVASYNSYQYQLFKDEIFPLQTSRGV